MTQPPPVDSDSRGIIDPRLFQQRLRLTRYPVPASLEGLVDWFWIVEWEFEPDESFTQDVLTHPGANISVSPEDGDAIEARLYGVSRHLSRRTMSGRGRAVAAMTRPGGLGPFVETSVETYTDHSVPLAAAMKVDADRLVADVVASPDGSEAAARLASALEKVLAAADPARIATALDVTAVARQAETDRSIRRVDALAAAVGVGVRTLQRMFREHAGVSPTWVLRRYRLLDAAERVRAGEPVSWAAVAHELGYADQAHLVRDFSAAIGRTPAAYATAVNAG
jgi:AraC-like DNA-binding protein